MNEHRAVSEISLGKTGITLPRFAFSTEYINDLAPAEGGELLPQAVRLHGV